MPGHQRAATYPRVCSFEQVEGYCVDDQNRAAKLNYGAHNWTIVRRYADQGKSARTDDLGQRPNVKRIRTLRVLLPFGIKKQIPVPDPAIYSGLLTAFQLIVESKSDHDAADGLNGQGYRPTGERGLNLLTKNKT